MACAGSICLFLEVARHFSLSLSAVCSLQFCDVDLVHAPSWLKQRDLTSGGLEAAVEADEALALEFKGHGHGRYLD
jgi:hypothetical protein